MLGFDDFAFGVLGAIPFFARFGQLAAAVLVERTGLRKHQFLDCATLHRGLWLVVACIPLVGRLFGLPLPGKWAVWLMLVALTASWLGDAFAAPAWFSWMGDIIPRRIRGRYMANRTILSMIVKIPVVIALGVWADSVVVEGAPMTADAQPALVRAIAIMFALAAAFGMADILTFRKMREIAPSTGAEPRRPAIDIRVPYVPGRAVDSRLVYTARYLRVAGDQLLLGPLRDAVFRRTVLCMAVITFAMTAAGAFCYLYILRSLGCSQLAADTLFMVFGPIVGMLSSRLWGRIIDKHGRRPALMLGMMCTSVSLLPYFFAMRHTPNPPFVGEAVNWVAFTVAGWFGQSVQPVITDASPVGAYLVMFASVLFGGVGWMGVGLGQTSIMLGFSDGQGRSKYVAAFNVIASIGGLLGGLAGGALAKGLSYYSHDGNPLVFGYFVFNNWHATFLLSWAARILGLVLLIRMPDPGSTPLRKVMADLGGGFLRRLSGPFGRRAKAGRIGS